MSQDLPIKKYPVTTSEVAKMLGIHSDVPALPMGTFESHSDLPVANLPVAAGADAHTQEKPFAHTDVHLASPAAEPQAQTASSQSKYIKIAKAAGPYVAVFAVGLFLYYFFFSTANINFGSLFQSAPKAITPSQSALEQLETADSVPFRAWILSFYYDVSDPKIISPESDNSGNGLSNFQKYLLHLNPKAYDTLGLGRPDSQTLAMGIDPATGMPLTTTQKALVAKYIDMEVVMNRLSLEALGNQGTVAGTSITTNNNNNPSNVNNNTNYNNNPVQNQPLQTNNVAPVTGANLGNDVVNANGISINTNIPGRLEIPDLKINVPIMWTKDTNNFETDLQSGVVHYPGTAMPGEIGTTYIAGHSSNYVWAKGSYNQVFSTLGKLAINTSFKITVVQSNGQNAIFHYVVTGSQQYSPTDQAQFANTGKSVVALSTCWPVNSTAKRLVVFGQLTQVEK